MEILERTVTKGIVKDGVFEVVEEKQIKDIIDPETDVWEAKGKAIISHNGVLKLAQYVGAIWDEPRLDDKPREQNGNGFYYLITCRFPDGTFSFESGEASDYNTNKERKTIDYRYKQTMALKRGMDRSFLRSGYMKMYDVYSEEEAEDFKEDVKTLKQTISKMKIDEKKMREIIKEIRDSITLDASDEKYPNEYVVNIWKKHRDIEYLQVLKEVKKEEKGLSFAINQILREAKKEIEAESEKIVENEEAAGIFADEVVVEEIKTEENEIQEVNEEEAVFEL